MAMRRWEPLTVSARVNLRLGFPARAVRTDSYILVTLPCWREGTGVGAAQLTLRGRSAVSTSADEGADPILLKGWAYRELWLQPQVILLESFSPSCPAL